MLRGNGLRVSELSGRGQVRFENIAQRRHADGGHFRQGLHEVLAAAAGADEAELQLLIRTQNIDCRHAEERRASGRRR